MTRLLALIAVALTSIGADCGAPPSPTIDATSCPPPTLEQCQKPLTSCDNHFRYLGRIDENSPCSLLLSHAAVSAAGLYPEKTVLTPKTWSGINAFPSDGGTTVVRAVPEDSPMVASGLSSFGFGQRTMLATQLKGQDKALAFAKRQLFLQQLGAYNANGAGLAECREYEFEKYFDIAAWDAQVLVSNASDDHRKAFEIAFGPANMRTSLGSRHPNDAVIRSRDGTPSGLTVPFELQRPKNDYFRVPVGTSSGEKVLFVKGSVDVVGVSPAYPGMLIVTLKSLPRTGLAISGVVFDDAALKPTIASGQRVADESFGWHRQQSDAMKAAGVLDEALFLEHERRDAFLELIEQRDEVARQISEYGSGGAEVPVAGVSRFTTRWWLDQRWNPNPTEATATINALTTQITQVANVNTSFNQQQNWVTYSNQPSPAKETLSPAGITSLSTGPNVQIPCNNTGNPFFCLVYRLAAIDQALEDELHAAQARGCLDTTRATACDWSPRDFTQRLRGVGDDLRERAYRKCDESVESFQDLKARALVQNRADGGVGVNYGAEDYTTSTTKLDQYFVRQDEYLDAVGEVVGPLLERKPVNGMNKLRLSRSEGEHHELGDKWFGATTTYSLSFQMDGIPASTQQQGNCAIKTRADATFGLTASVLHVPIQLVDASVHAQDEYFSARVQVLDQLWEMTKPTLSGMVPVYSDSQMAYETFLQGDATFAIGYILISVGAAVSGGVGYGVKVEVRRDQVVANGCTVSRLGVVPEITPFVFVDGSAYAALEAIVARAGIKGYLTIAYVAVPIAGEVSVGPTQNDVTVLDARFQIGAKLRLKFFGGRIVVFAEVGVCPLCASFEGELVSWDGIQSETELFNYELTVRLADLKRVAARQGVIAGSP